MSRLPFCEKPRRDPQEQPKGKPSGPRKLPEPRRSLLDPPTPSSKPQVGGRNQKHPQKTHTPKKKKKEAQVIIIWAETTLSFQQALEGGKKAEMTSRSEDPKTRRRERSDEGAGGQRLALDGVQDEAQPSVAASQRGHAHRQALQIGLGVSRRHVSDEKKWEVPRQKKQTGTACLWVLQI